MNIGLDIGSTTIKCIVLDDALEVIYHSYKRHYSHIKDSIVTVLKELKEQEIVKGKFKIAISGSAGMGIANNAKITFVQEVYATKVAANKLIPDIDCIIELGGEDAKILFLSDGLEVRMNGTCAGGTGAFIDQMSNLLNIDASELNTIAKDSTKLYSIASRCGVFAKTDIQPLLNQGANRSDVAASIFTSVVNQTIGGLAQGREITGKVAYLGGPLTFLSELQAAFDKGLKTKGITPDHSLYFVAIGAGLCAESQFEIDEITTLIEKHESKGNYAFNNPLFNTEKELEQFRNRHKKNNVPLLDLVGYTKPVYLGIDSGSTTLKLVLIDEDKNIRYESYSTNQGNPVNVLKDELTKLYQSYPRVNIAGSASTGYGEDIMKSAFKLDSGLVETMAHFIAAKRFMPKVDFIIDIGGQDMKCFKIENGIITNIFLNEACSAGCGSFLQTFANVLGYNIEEFAKIGLMAPKPVDLGSRCTVFMNSSVKQAQKDGATIDNISAGLSISVVKNALYKVVRATSAEDLGKNIVVQGGTFYNEAVLRAFERELNLEVVAPNISGLMGAYGAALHAMELKKPNGNKIKNVIESLLKEQVPSSTINLESLKKFKHEVKNVNCKLCSNNCSLSINTFDESSSKYISGNKCERPIATKKSETGDDLNLYAFIRQELTKFEPIKGKRGQLAIPLVLSNYELLPFWHTFFSSLDFEVHHSGLSNKKTYTLGQHTIPSDTICYPAKLVHGHIERLLIDNFKTIFYPCMSYNMDEKQGDNHFNCPVVAYYPEVIKNNSKLEDINFIYDYIGIHDKNMFIKKVKPMLKKISKDIKDSEIILAATNAYYAHHTFIKNIRDKAQKIIHVAKQNKQQIVVLAGRPYHVDPEVNHGIDKLISSFDVAIITEESVSHLVDKPQTNILNQWTYHSRLYAAAEYVSMQNDMNLIQLVSFGCGLDAVTTDETKEILERRNKVYTQIKIDEIANLGAVKIRLRSLFAAINQMKEE